MRWPSTKSGALAALSGAVLLILVAPFHGAAYLATEDGSVDATAFQKGWARSLREALPAAFDFAGEDRVYKTYGLGTAVSFSLLAVAFLAYQGSQETRLTGWRRNVGRVAAVTWSLLALATLVEYVTPYTDQLFIVAGPSLLLSLILTVVAGFAAGTRGQEPAWVGRALAVGALVLVPLVAVFGHIPMGALGLAVAWILIARRWLRRDVPA